MRHGECGVYAALPPPWEGREVVFDKPSAQVKHNKNQVGKTNVVISEESTRKTMEKRPVATTNHKIT